MNPVNQQTPADRLGLSRTTVSRCFTNHRAINPTTWEPAVTTLQAAFREIRLTRCRLQALNQAPFDPPQYIQLGGRLRAGESVGPLAGAAAATRERRTANAR